jgi:hypothetical protein
MGLIITALVGRFPLTLRLVYARPNIFLLSIKVPSPLVHKAAGMTLVLSPFEGCAQYTSQIGYVADPACDSSSSKIQLITLVRGRRKSQGYRLSVY